MIKIENTFIAFDTSALIDIFFYSERTQKDLYTNLLPSISKLLYIPSHVVDEFKKHKNTKVFAPLGKYDDLIRKRTTNKETGYIEEIGKKVVELRGLIKTLFEQFGDNDKHPIVEYEKSNIISVVDSLDCEILNIENEINLSKNKLEARLEKIANEDLLYKFIIKNTSNNIVLSYADKLKIAKEGSWRYANNIPPGYKDAEKNRKTDISKFGDLFIWKEILRESEKQERNLIFVSNDAKDDWLMTVKKDGKSARVARTELVEEYAYHSGGYELEILNMSNFLYKMKRLYQIDISVPTLTEIEQHKSIDDLYLPIVKQINEDFSIKECIQDYSFPNSKEKVDLLFITQEGNKIAVEYRGIKVSRDHLLLRRNKLVKIVGDLGLSQMLLYLHYDYLDEEEIKFISELNLDSDIVKVIPGFIINSKFKKIV